MKHTDQAPVHQTGQTKRLPFHTKLSYGIGGITDNAMYTLAITYLLFFLTSIAGLPPAVAGLFAACGSVWEAICGPVVGYFSDSVNTRFGKRKPFLLAAALPILLVITFLFTPVSLPSALKNIYYLIFVLLFWMTFSSFFVPYISWGSELTEDYNERTELRGFAYIGNLCGMAAGMVLPSLLSGFFPRLGISLQHSWTLTGLAIGILASFSIAFCALTIHESDNPHFQKPPRRTGKDRIFSLPRILAMFSEYGAIFRLRPVRFIIASSVIYLIADVFFASAIVYQFKYVIGLGAGKTSLSLLAITGTGIVLSPIVSKLSAKTDKPVLFRAGIATSGIILIIFGFFGVRSFTAGLILCIIYSMGNTCYWQLMPSMLYDVCEAEELASGARHAGQVISMQALSESLASAVGVWCLGLVLQFSGFAGEAAVQSPLTVAWIGYCVTFITGFLFLLVSLVITKHPINKRNYARIVSALSRRKSGEEVDMNDLRDIYG